ncbi:hypothetical protein CYMTET_17230 [Cymbomonas tetramitiformis]|uniref:Biogenesis of lysosome-related organelles complex 1 subunit 3 n=1 Tax=Cymbomonas tetramitiformis TaxID=36881 RepID=A0AAE0L7C3_9CHLO|nr:hypothetical protein CYMTET_17230 [Cymbomonas tetramitiformis]
MSNNASSNVVIEGEEDEEEEGHEEEPSSVAGTSLQLQLPPNTARSTNAAPSEAESTPKAEIQCSEERSQPATRTISMSACQIKLQVKIEMMRKSRMDSISQSCGKAQSQMRQSAAALSKSSAAIKDTANAMRSFSESLSQLVLSRDATWTNRK